MEEKMAVSARGLGATLAAFAAVLLAVVLLSSPAFAQAEGGSVNIQYLDCSQVQAAAAEQGQYGVAVGDGATAELAQELNITQEQVNACLGSIGSEDRRDGDDGDVVVGVEDDETGEGKVIASSIPEKDVLAATGGMPLPGTALLAFALIGTGLSVLRFGIRRD